MPLVGATVFAVDDLDERVSDWAIRRTPVYGSTRDAQEWSDDLAFSTRVAMYATALATASGEEPGAWLAAKSAGLLVEAAATAGVRATTAGIKRLSDRERPDQSDGLSFPSGHTSSASSHAALAARNLRAISGLPSGLEQAGAVTFRSAAFATGWARVEAGRHYPSDVLVGAALGNFLATFAHDAFLGLPENVRLELSGEREGFLLGLRWSF